MAVIWLIAPLWAMGALFAVAGPGRPKISQACAIQAGCFPGDTPGFPVDISRTGSYLLTSDLEHDPSAHGSTEIVRLLADDITLDLNGFTIRSTSSCDTETCEIGTIDGIDSSTADRVTIRNGRVVGVNGNCIRVANEALIEHVAVSHCGNLGISVGANSIVMDCSSTSTGRTGLHVSAFTQPSGTLYRDSVFSRNGLRGEDTLPDIAASVSRHARATGPNVCQDGLCGSGERRYYLTPSGYLGNQPLDGCEPGFHFASWAEIRNVSNLRYDTRRGQTRHDSGSGPPVNLQGWTRSGHDSSIGLVPPANCNTWTSDDAFAQGSTARLQGFDGHPPVMVLSIPPCNTPFPVWCIED